MNILRQSLYILYILFWFAIVPMSVAGSVANKDNLGEAVFAKVGDSVISVQTYKQALIKEGRSLFYHGQPPVEELVSFQKKIADKLIVDELLRQEADRQGITADDVIVDTQLEKHRKRAHRHGQKVDENSSQWQALRKGLEEGLRIQQIEQRVRDSIAAPSEENLRRYYQANLDKFTEPTQWHVSNIVLTVTPSSEPEVWVAAREEAQKLIERLRSGADFEAMARLHSGDVSSAKGGDMGYLHTGMLRSGAQAVIEKLTPGQISDPLTALEGIVIFRLNNVRPSRTQNFAQARQRVEIFWRAEYADNQWQKYVENLRATTAIELNERYLRPSGEINN